MSLFVFAHALDMFPNRLFVNNDWEKGLEKRVRGKRRLPNYVFFLKY